MIVKATNLDTLYRHVVRHVYECPQFASSPRGMATREVIGATAVLTDPRARLIDSPARGVNYRFAAAEFMWYWLGREDVAFIERYNARLRQFSADGATLNSAYGRRIFGPDGHGDRNWPGGSQWANARQLLRHDPDSRRAVINILQPTDAGSPLDVPCTSTLQFLIRDGELHLHVHMRSNDVFWGMPYDIFSFTLMQEAMAIELGVGLGEYIHTVGSLHIYERHFGDAERIIAEPLPGHQNATRMGQHLDGTLEIVPVIGRSAKLQMPPLTPDDIQEEYFNRSRLHSLWGACNAEAYVSTRRPIPEAMRPPRGSGEEWLIDRLYEKWGPASEESE